MGAIQRNFVSRLKFRNSKRCIPPSRSAVDDGYFEGQLAVIDSTSGLAPNST